ncbi:MULTISPECIES: GH25 family lysozyme [Cellulomonas]|uniref:GH25 family lysozyme n=1 Tax=Cellulomonas TaxID=1707 RepID=UPI002101763D|nr:MULTISPECIES: GH25 family lysozyme [Cellulomonas]
MLVGAYHFFSFESSGRAQAEHVLATVPDDEDLLPLAIDVEYYGTFHADPPDSSQVRPELTALIETLRDHGVEPVVYATSSAYGPTWHARPQISWSHSDEFLQPLLRVRIEPVRVASACPAADLLGIERVPSQVTAPRRPHWAEAA